jgi:hypothetical protein
MPDKSFTDKFDSAVQAWVTEVVQKIQVDYASDTGAQLEEVTTTSGSGKATLSFTVPDSSKLNIPTTEVMEWVPATSFAGKDKSGRPTMKRRKGYQRKRKLELPKKESFKDGTEAKPSKTGSTQNVYDKIFEYHFGDEFSNFLIKHLSGQDMKVKRLK